MRFIKPAVFVALGFGFGLGATGGAVQAKLLHQVKGPAEFPPRTFKGKQFVDSRGCVFVRAGYGATITWVPRVQRNRKQICGYKPTFAKPATQVAAAAPKPTPKLTPKPSAKPVSKPVRVAAAPTAAAAAPAPRRLPHTPSPSPAPTSFSAPKVVASAVPAAPAARVVRPQAVRPAASRHTPSPAPAPTDFSRPKIVAAALVPASSVPASSVPVRRVAVLARPAPVPSPAPAPTVVSRPAAKVAVVAQEPIFGLFALRPAAHRRVTAPAPAPVAQPVRFVPPKGYKPAWTDGRLNPNRAIGTARGQAEMEMIWSNTVPRHLIVRR